MAMTSDLARGIAQQLRTWVPILPAILPRMPQPMAEALCFLLYRAAALKQFGQFMRACKKSVTEHKF
jgi:hypothetical protein